MTSAFCRSGDQSEPGFQFRRQTIRPELQTLIPPNKYQSRLRVPEKSPCENRYRCECRVVQQVFPE